MKTEDDRQQAATDAPRPHAELLSALADGEATAAETEFLTAHWAQSATVRADWHAYHLIGDAMRSAELSTVPDRDEALLAAVRRRLADEPVVLAPQPLPSRMAERRTRRRWISSAAMVAGVATVGVALMVSRQGLPGADGASEATRLADSAVRPAVTLTAVAGPHGVKAVAGADEGEREGVSSAEALGTGRVLRDEQLDRYLAAHRQFGGPVVPGQVLRSATTLAPAER